MSSVNILKVRRRLGREAWLPPEQFGPDGWSLMARDGSASVIISCSDHPDDPHEWLHVSMARYDGRVPSYDEMCALHHAVWGDGGYAYQAHVPLDRHVNIHEHALHLWGRLDGTAVLPEFGLAGSI